MPTSVTLYDITPFSKTNFLLSAVTDIATIKYSDVLKKTNEQRTKEGKAPIKEWKPKWSICEDGTFQALVSTKTAKSFLKEVWNAIPKSLQPHFRIGLIECPDYPAGRYIFIGPIISCADIDKLLLDAPNYQHNQEVLDYIKGFFPEIKPTGKIDPTLTYKVFSTPESNRMYCYHLPVWFADNCSLFSLPINPDDYNSFKAEYQRPDRVKSLPPSPMEIREVPPIDKGADLPYSDSSDSLANANGEAAATEASPKAAIPLLAAAPTPAITSPVTATGTTTSATGTTTTVLPMLSPIIPAMFGSAFSFTVNAAASIGSAIVFTPIAMANNALTSLATLASPASPAPEENEDDGFMMAAPDRSTLRALTRADIVHALTYELQDMRSDNPEEPITPPDSPLLK